MDHLSARLHTSDVTPRSSSRSLLPTRRLNTIKESGALGEQPATSAQPHSPFPGVDVLDERGPGSLGGSSLRGRRRAPVPTPRRRSSEGVDEDPADSERTGDREEPVRPPQLPPPRGWVPENHDPREIGAGNPLLRHSSQGSGGTGSEVF